MAVDPKTHDVFLSSDQKIVRVHNLTGKKPVVTTFITGSGSDLYDALAFNASGSILYVTDRYNYPNIHVVGFNRAGKSVLDVVDPYQGEGLAVAKNGVLFINNNGTERRLACNLWLRLDARAERDDPDDSRERRHPRRLRGGRLQGLHARRSVRDRREAQPGALPGQRRRGQVLEHRQARLTGAVSRSEQPRASRSSRRRSRSRTSALARAGRFRAGTSPCRSRTAS